MPPTIPFLSESRSFRKQCCCLSPSPPRLPAQTWIRLERSMAGDVAPDSFPVYEKCREAGLQDSRSRGDVQPCTRSSLLWPRPTFPATVGSVEYGRRTAPLIVGPRDSGDAASDRRLFLYDNTRARRTMETRDTNVGPGPFQWMMQLTSLMRGGSSGHLLCPIEEVRTNMQTHGDTPTGRRFLVTGMARQLPAQAPQTHLTSTLGFDLYRSTYHELTHLFPGCAVA